MKKSILLFAIIASVFVACEQPNVNYENQDVYGVWTRDKNDSIFIFINDKNTKFISKDSLKIYHGHWKYTEISDLGYVEYKYKIIKNEKLKIHCCVFMFWFFTFIFFRFSFPRK